ncbi:hypothetical protein BH10PSE18_BH10PSE18_21930 [soil metagenome]
MNKNFHRVVFNAARGLRMVVQETARSTGRGTSKATCGSAGAAISVAAIAAALMTSPLHAQIVADPSSPANQRPPVLAAPNGVPVVVIATPSAAGVSRNRFSQFDVNANGVIINNSRSAVPSQLGGYLQANPYLIAGPARVILNEVNSSNSSYLNGPVEIAGQRAEFILANPSGIQVNGTTFINASTVTLTTGTPQFGASGNLAGYAVRGGTVTIGGTGMDASASDYTAILARAAQINAGLWAKDLKIVTGVSDISADASQVTQVSSTAGTGATPRFALDVAALGGMYSGHIFLVGTEAGLGARNAGAIIASADGAPTSLAGAGQLVVISAGRLENIGTLQAGGDMSLSASAMANSGTVTSGGTLTAAATQGDVSNNLNGVGGALQGQSVVLGAAGDLHNELGTIRQQSAASLSLSASTLSNTNGGVIGLEPVAVSSGAGSSGSAGAGSATTSGTGATGSVSSGSPASAGAGTTTSTVDTAPMPGTIAAVGTIFNDAGKVYAGGPITLQTANLVNSGGSLNVASLTLNQPSFSNQVGTLNVSGAFNADLGELNNSGGTLHAGHLQLVTTGDLLNVDGTLTSDTDASLAVGGTLDNTRGTLSSVGALTADVAGAFLNAAGTVLSNQLLSVTAQSVDNTAKGSLQSSQAGIQITVSQELANGNGVIAAATDLDFQAGSLTINDGGNLRGGRDATLTVTDTLANDGSITAGRNTTLATGSLQGSTTSVLGAGMQNDGTLGSVGDLQVTARHGAMAQGIHLAAANLSVQGGSIDLTHSQTSAANIALTATQGDITTSGATVTTPGALAVTANSQATQALINKGGDLYAGQLDLHASNIANTNGGRIVQTGAGATVIAMAMAGTLDNSAGVIASNGDTTIAAGGLTNQGGTIRATGTADLDIATTALLDNSAKGQIAAGGRTVVGAGSLNNDGGRITAVSDLALTTSGTTTNVGGLLGANGNTTVSALSLDSTNGTVAAVKGDLTVATSGVTTSNGGDLFAGGSITLNNSGLSNVAGVVAGNSLSIATHGKQLDNTQGTLTATTRLDIQSGALINDAGLIQSGGPLTVDTHGQTLTNTHADGYATQQGGIAGADTLSLTTGALNNSGGYIGAKTLAADTQTVSNTEGGVIVSQGVARIDTHGASYDNTRGQTFAHGDLNLSTGASGIENRRGAIVSDASATLTSAGTLNNSNGGLLSAGDTLTLQDSNVGTANPSRTLSVVNTGGTIFAVNAVRIDAANVGLDGQLLTQGDVSLSQTQDITVQATGQTIANHDLRLTTAGAIYNSGALSAGNALTLTATRIDNSATGQISAGASTTLNTGDTLTNRGLIDGVETRIDAGTVNNLGTGRIYGDHIAIAAGTLNNDAETVDGVTHAGTIAARNRLDIGVDVLNNRNGALIYSAGDLAIGGALDAAGHTIGAASTVTNTAATIQAGRDLSLSANQLNNLNGGVAYTLVAGTPQTVVQYAAAGGAQRYDPSEVRFLYYGLQSAANPALPGNEDLYRLLLPSTRYPFDGAYAPYYNNAPTISYEVSQSQCTGSGEDSSCVSVPVPGARYAHTDPIWAAFGIAPPAEDLPDDFIGHTAPEISVGQDCCVARQVGNAEGNPDIQYEPFDHPVTQAEYDTWKSNHDRWQAFARAHQDLDAATVAFLADMRTRTLSTWYDLQYVQTTNTPVLTQSSPGQISAGGALTLNIGHATNSMSQIVAGGDLNVHGGSVNNVGQLVDTTATQTGQMRYSYIKSHTFRADTREYQSSAYDTTIDTTTTLAAARLKGNTAVGIGASLPGAIAGGHTDQSASSASTGARVSPILEVPAAMSGSGATAGTGASSGATGGHALDAPDTTPVIRTSTPSLTLPTASLFSLQPGATSHYLVETDPRFANYRNWLSSDYLLNQLGSDPNTTLKRLGDGFYEQQLIDSQVLQLTGSRYLAGFGNDQDEYTALMNNGASFAKQYGLSVGVALTAAQMAQLTSDIVWLVQQTVTLADGSTQTVLVPQVYVRTQTGDLDGSGALLAGRNVNINLSGNLNNVAGTVAGRDVVMISADNVNNLAARISGNAVGIAAMTDINNIGAQIDAQSLLMMNAGRDLNVVSTARASSNAAGTLSDTVIDRVAGLYVANGALSASAGRDVNLVSARLIANGDIDLSAGRDLRVSTVTTAHSEDLAFSGQGQNTRQASTTTDVGSTVGSLAGRVELRAGRDVTAQAVQIDAAQDIGISAGRDVSLIAGHSTTQAEDHHQTGTKGWITTKTTTEDLSQSQDVVRSTLDAGGGVRIASGMAGQQGASLAAAGLSTNPDSPGDITLAATTVTAQSLSLNAADGRGNVNLPVQQSTLDSSHASRGSSTFWESASGSGVHSETANYNQFNLGDASDPGNPDTTTRPDITAAQVNVQVGVTRTTRTHNNNGDTSEQTTQDTLPQTLQALSTQPGMQWMAQLQNDPALAGKVDWQQVDQTLRTWDYGSSHLSGAGAALVVVIVTAVTMGTGTAEAVAATTATAVGGAVGTAVGAAAAAGFTTLAGEAAVSLVNNGGDLGKTLQELGAKDSVKSILGAMLTAGAIQGIAGNITVDGAALDASGAPQQMALSNVTPTNAGFGANLELNLLRSGMGALVNTAVQGGSLADSLQNALKNGVLDTVAAQAAQTVGGLSMGDDALLDSFTNKVAHAIAGCAVGAARADNGGGCAAGALGAAIGEMAAEAYGEKPGTAQFASAVAAFAVALAGGDASQVNLGSQAGANAASYNFLGHTDTALRNALRIKATQGTLTNAEAARLVALEVSDQSSDGLLAKYRSGQPMSEADKSNLLTFLAVYNQQNGAAATVELMQIGSPTAGNYQYPYAGTKEQQLAYMSQLRADSPWGVFASPAGSADQSTFNAARIQSQLYLNTASNESFLPSNQLTPEQESSLALIDALRNSPVLGSSTYLYNVATGASAEQASAATQLANLISDIGASVVLPRTSVSPVTGQTTAAVAGGGASEGANGGVATAGGTANTVSGARLNMQLTAEEAAGTRAPATITSYSDHAVTQIGSRDGGIGVSQAAVNDAFANPVSIQYVPSKYGPTFKYIGQNATVVVNSEGNVVTTWATNSTGTGK